MTIRLAIFVSSLTLLHVADAQEPIRIGKTHQLFLDDHLIEHTEHRTRRVQQARKHEANPLFVKEHDWEQEGWRALTRSTSTLRE